MTLLFEGEPVRIDSYLANEAEYSRTRVQSFIKDGLVLVNGKTVKPNYLCSSGDTIVLTEPEMESYDVVAQNIPIDIIYEDESLVVINKPQGMVVHPAPGHPDGTLVNGLLYHVHDLSGIGGVGRPGIVHRIDRMTSGLLVVAKNDAVHLSLSEQFAAHSAGREYLALASGCFSETAATVDAPIGRSVSDRKKMAVTNKGKPAITHYEVLEQFRNIAFIKCVLETGRTHQIRVHMAYIHHPLCGDDVYGNDKNALGFEGQALHGYKLHLKHPGSGKEMTFYAPIPDYFTKALHTLGSSYCIDSLYLDNPVN